MVYRKPFFPVSQAGRIVGLVFLEDLKRIPIELRNEYIVGCVMKRISDFPIIDEDMKGDIVMSKMNILGKKPFIFVVKEKGEDKIVGFISQEEILSALKYAELEIKA